MFPTSNNTGTTAIFHGGGHCTVDRDDTDVTHGDTGAKHGDDVNTSINAIALMVLMISLVITMLYMLLRVRRAHNLASLYSFILRLESNPA